MKKYNLYHILALIITAFIGLWIRFTGVLTDSFAFTYDVGRDLLVIHNFVISHKPFLIGQTTGLPGLFYGPWWYYFLSVPFFLFSGDPQYIAGFMALIGVICVLLAYLAGYKIRDKSLGFILAVLLSFSPYFVGLSAQIWNPNISQLYLLLMILIFLNIFKSGKNTNKLIFFLQGVLLGLLLDSEIVFGILILIGVVISFIVHFRNNIKLNGILLLVTGLLITQSPRILFELRHDFIQTRTILSGVHIADNSGFSLPSANTLFERVWVFNSMFADTFTGGNKIFSLILVLIMFLSYKFYRNSLNLTEKNVLKLSLTLLTVLFFGILFLNRPAWGHYLIGLPVIYLFIFGFSIDSIRFHKYGKHISILLLLIVALMSLNPVKLIKENNQPLWEGNAAVYRNQIAVVDYVYSQANGKPFNLIVYTPAVHAYSYNYLFLWYGQKKYGYQPSDDKTKLFMLIIEPDYDNDWRIEEWLKVRKNDGSIVKEVTVKGGIRVQIRNH